jgi:hypothetical protein
VRQSRYRGIGDRVYFRKLNAHVFNMIDRHDEPDNSNRDLDRPANAERSESSGNADDASTSSYYYDDSTGYEVYDADDEDDGEEK